MAAEIGVAISTRDRPEGLSRCLESLRAGSLLPAEVVVADQSSDSRTRQVVAAAGGPELCVRCVDGGVDGLAEAQNSAFRHVATPVVAVLDDDCVADHDWIAVLERTFAVDPQLALVGGRVRPLGPVGAHRYAVSSRTSAVPGEFAGRSAPPWQVGSGNNFALRREWFARVGGCDERLGPGTPGQGALDMDLFYRVLRAGGRGRYEPSAVIYHERATRQGRMSRRWPYGHGMGAMCIFRLREGDRYGLRLLGAWVGLRGRLLAAALARRRWHAIREEVLVLGGTTAGIAHAIMRKPRSADRSRSRWRSDEPGRASRARS